MPVRGYVEALENLRQIVVVAVFGVGIPLQCGGGIPGFPNLLAVDKGNESVIVAHLQVEKVEITQIFDVDVKWNANVARRILDEHLANVYGVVTIVFSPRIIAHAAGTRLPERIVKRLVAAGPGGSDTVIFGHKGLLRR